MIPAVGAGLFKTDLAADWSKRENGLGRAAPPPPEAAVSLARHDAATLPPSTLLDQMKRLIRDTVSDAAPLTPADVTGAAERLTLSLERRCDVTPVAFRCLHQLSFDFLFVACECRRPACEHPVQLID